MMATRIAVAGPLDLEATLRSGQAFRWRRDGDGYTGVVAGNAVRLRRTKTGVEFTSFPEPETQFAPRLADYLGLADDLEAAYRSLEADPYVKAAITRHRGMRILRQEPWECLVSFICSAWSNVQRVSNTVEALASRFGRPILVNGSAFPTPEEMAEVDEKALRALGLGFRAKYIPATARLVAEGRVNLMALREAPYEEALDTVMSLPGVGDKVANCIMLFSLDQRSAFPVDLWIRRALCGLYLGDAGQTMSVPRLRLWAQERFGPYAGYANHYLFHDRRLAGR
ncbi:MAG: hypothetical protein FJ317_09845 [SAR202 cluster bacterium]|nr:hypothetical protein [SAR202 cluster bacterium]